jgi:hypothetical protein
MRRKALRLPARATNSKKWWLSRHVGFESPTIVLWSPDSKKILTHKLDERKVRDMPIVQSTPTDGTVRPVATMWRMAMPNDRTSR